LFLTSSGAKARLAPHVAADRQADVLGAPVCAVVGYDAVFAEQLVGFLPSACSPSCLGDPETARRTAQRNGALQGAYLIVAARWLSLETVAISGFDADAVAAEFFRNRRIQATFVCTFGYAAPPAA
jgi:nitroreductase